MHDTSTTGDVQPDSAERSKPPKTITVEFNFQPLDLPKEEMTGAEIKAAAINASLPIQPNFVLSVANPSGKFDVVGDTDTVKIHKGLTFICVDGDDNS